jgi:ring-1,2-phenylacetyl-CoA epoxidase subunit PaaD
VTTLSEAWDVLSEVMDPEIPVVSVVDLGIVRDVAVRDGGHTVQVTLTPTYTGCPATAPIRRDVEAVLRRRFEAVRVNLQLAPAWTTDWITPDGKRRLEHYGIAPPNPHLDRPRACPQCGSNNTELLSEFGSTPCKALYRCRDCREPFDYFKCL